MTNPFETPLTCQICGTMHNALEGFIARHGHKRIKATEYMRGYMTDGCFGSRKKPFEVSRDALAVEIESLNDSVFFWFNEASGYEDVDYASHCEAYAYAQHDRYYLALGRQQARFDAWVQTITDEQWTHNRDVVMHTKRNAATLEGWDNRTSQRRLDEREDEPTEQVHPPMLLRQFGTVVARFTTAPTGDKVFECIPNHNDTWEVIDTHADWATVEKMFGDDLIPA